MKKILFILALVVANSSNAQKKGSILVMGNIEYFSENVSNSGSESKYNVFGFRPKVGYQFHQNWTTGLEAGISSSKQELSYDQEFKTNNFSVGGFLRYLKPLNQTFSLYADLGAGYQNRKEKSNYPDQPLFITDEGDGFYIAITPSIYMDINKGFGLNFNIGSLGYNTLSYNDAGRDVKNFNFSFGQQFSVGISKNF